MIRKTESGISYTLGDLERDADVVHAEVMRYTYLPRVERKQVDFAALTLSVENGRLVLSDDTHPMRKGELSAGDRTAFLDELAKRWNAQVSDQ